MRMRALKSFTYPAGSGHRLAVGDEFDTRKDLDAKLLKAGRRAIEVASPAAAAPAEPPKPPEPIAPAPPPPSSAPSSPPQDAGDDSPGTETNSGGNEKQVPIPDDWRELPWVSPREPGGQTLRGLASAFSEQPIRSKDDAIGAIEAEIAKRAAT